jgi:hypothetical protein
MPQKNSSGPGQVEDGREVKGLVFVSKAFINCKGQRWEKSGQLVFAEWAKVIGRFD